MKLNHLNLAVTDVPQARAFLIKYFGLKSSGKESPMIGFVTDDNGMVLTLTNIDHATEVHYPPTFHIGFIQESEQQVNEINARLKDDGYDVPPPGKAHGAWTFYFLAPGGFVIEVLC